ncbi:hypothetical protein HCO87_003105 [Salmonella enterica subsp. enterica serovar Reading]|nr:hypothetical protein [Salmonella enterica subsp. enterica serovar Reading]
MNIVFHDRGAVANVIITSNPFALRKHNRVVDAALLCTPGITESRSGFFLVKSVLSGRTKEMLRAYKTVLREANR